MARDADAVNKLAATMTKLTGALDTLVKTPSRLTALGGGVGGSGASVLGLPAGMTEKLVAPITQAFTKITSSIMASAGPLVSMIDKFNPALVQQFEFAFNDLMAVMGEILQPILKAITELTRKLADTFKTMKPVFDPIINAVVKLIGLFAKLIEPMARLMVPVLNLVAVILENIVIPVLEKFVDALTWLSKAVIGIVNEILKAYNWVVNSKVGKALGLRSVGLIGFDELEKRSAAGTAIRGTQRFGTEDIGERTREAALGQTFNQIDLLKDIKNNTGRSANAQDNLIKLAMAQFGLTEEQVRILAKQLGYNLE